MEPTRIARGTNRSVLAVTATIAIAIVVGGLALAAIDRSSPGAASEASSARPESVAAASPVERLLLPPSIRCHDLASRRCARIARAALAVTGDPSLPTITTLDV